MASQLLLVAFTYNLPFTYNLRAWPAPEINYQESSAVALVAAVTSYNFYQILGCLLVCGCLSSSKAVLASGITGGTI